MFFTRNRFAETAVQQHQLRHCPGRGGAIPHRDADIGVFQRERIIDAVAGHRDYVPPALQRGHNGPFLMRTHPPEDAVLLQNDTEFIEILRQSSSVDRIVLTAG
jgi:hypothetical protein